LNQVAQLKKNLMEDLELCKEEAEIFLALIEEGKTSSEDFKKKLDCTTEEMVENCKRLEQKGMVIEINKNEFQVLHPRFAIVNRYRRICAEKNIQFKKNIKIDNIGIMLERYQDKKN
jgi:predicted transcriptional regulator